MSAIIGLFHFDGQPADIQVLEQMVASLAHRGSGESYTWCQGPVGLGHQALRTTPESLHVTFPLRSETNDLVLTADARIDNRDELIKILNLQDGLPGEMSDEELILKAYEQWGEACPEKLLGDFAFALWDKKEHKVFCARDHLGIKPFYYYRSDRIFLFASEIKALFQHPQTQKRLNEVRVADYLAMTFEDKEITFFQNVFRLPPGCCLAQTIQSFRKRFYWALDPQSELRLASKEDYADAFREIFIQAVQCRLRTAAPMGFLLSGGLDSSSIVCAAHGLLSQTQNLPLISFSASFPDFPQVDEQAYIDAVLAMGDIEPHYLRADRISPLYDIEKVLWHEDEPFHAPNLFVYWALVKAAQERGVVVLLDGIDGDNIVSHGLEFLTELGYTGKWWNLAWEIRWLSSRFNRSSRKLFNHYILKPLIFQPVRNMWHVSLGKGETPYLPVPYTVNRAFAQRIQWEDRYGSLLKDRAEPVQSQKMEHWRTLTSGITPYYMESCDKVAKAFGLDHRHPFYDLRLLEFCFAIPSDQKLHKGWDRVVQRRAMEGIIPHEIQWRVRKSHWGPNFKRGMMEFDRPILEGVIFKESDLIKEYVDIAALKETYHQCRAGKISTQDGMNLWVAVTLALWLSQTHISI